MRKIDLNNEIFKTPNEKLEFKKEIFNFINDKLIKNDSRFKDLRLLCNINWFNKDKFFNILSWVSLEKVNTYFIKKNWTNKIRCFTFDNKLYYKENIDWVTKWITEIYKDFQKSNLWREFIKKFTNAWICVCPYCNIDYISYIEVDWDKWQIVPTIDHIEDKGSNPFMNALNIDNMIPSCYTCNSNLKWSKELRSIFYPYIKDGDKEKKEIYNDFNFSIIPENWSIYNNIYSDINKLIINYDTNQNVLQVYLWDITIKKELSFYIKERLESRQQVIKDILVENLIYNNSVYQKWLLSINWQYSLYYNQKQSDLNDIHKIPYSKLYLDIKKQFWF